MALYAKVNLFLSPSGAQAEVAHELDGEILDLLDEETVLFVLHFGIRLTAGRWGVSERTLRRQFERRGVRLCDLLQERRRDLTRRLLAGDLPVGTIALRLGFSSSQTFARYLRREFGTTARELRRRIGSARGPDKSA
jgi:AraC-like DNA-binding protein